MHHGSQAGALGAACLAAVGAGEYPDVWAAARRMVRVASTLTPDADVHSFYNQRYDELFLPLYARVSDLFRRLQSYGIAKLLRRLPHQG